MICVLAVSNVPLNVLQAVVVNVNPDGLTLDPGPDEDNASTSEKSANAFRIAVSKDSAAVFLDALYSAPPTTYVIGSLYVLKSFKSFNLALMYS